MSYKDKIHKRIDELGYHDINIRQNKGGLSHMVLDLPRWYANVRRGNKQIMIDSYYTMKDCVKYGFTLNETINGDL